MSIPTILDEILHWKRGEVERNKAIAPLEAVRAEAVSAQPPRDFAAALRPPGAADVHGVRLIAEVKQASPSKGLLRLDLDAVALACEYADNGAAAISVLTDERYFQGSLEHLRAVRRAVSLPVLRKDFVLDPYQVYEARAAGTDAVLLIMAALSDDELKGLYQLIRELRMAALVEVHDEAELERALKIDPANGRRILGVNNRDLHTFEVNLETTARLRSQIPADVVLVAESGIHNHADVARLAAIGVDAMLVGEALVRAENVGQKMKQLLGKL